MDIKRAKQEIKDSIEAYLAKDEFGEYLIPAIRQRPILLMGAPGIGKTQIMEQIARECKVGLVSYTITHHTRQSAVGLPIIKEKTFGQHFKPVQRNCRSRTDNLTEPIRRSDRFTVGTYPAGNDISTDITKYVLRDANGHPYGIDRDA